MGVKCLLGKCMVNTCNLCNHCVFIFGHPVVIVDNVSECIARWDTVVYCVSEKLIPLLGHSQSSFRFLQHEGELL